MKIYFNVKQAGKRKNYITKREFILNTNPKTLKQLLAEIIKSEVENFNDKNREERLLDYLTNEEIETRLQVGRVSFGEKYNQNDADYNKALETALLAYEDGIFRVFIGDKEADQLDENLELKEEDVLTFIRLTMLSGRMW
jgi:hypothetical protein